MDIKQIRAAIATAHGGFQTASDQQVARFWQGLPRHRRDELLARLPVQKPKAQTPSSGA